MKLFIDTTTKYVTITTFDSQIINNYQYVGNNNHTTTIYEQLAKIDLNAVTAVYVTSGPGSYTGVRIGVLVAKTLASELGIDLYAINTLKLFYAGNNQSVLLDARGKKYFKYDGSAYTQIGYDDVTSEIIIDHHVNPNWLIDVQILSKFEIKNPNSIEIEYLKAAI